MRLARRAADVKRFVSFILVSIVVIACIPEPRERPDIACADACKAHKNKCDEHECERGCAFVIDRLVEHQQTEILACVEQANACDDPVWAECGAKIGAHADGGPDTPPHVEQSF
jgi:hypothetical protein